ncbi:MBL fold metallo-hydrolase [Bradyrhizobium japonicum]|uniref:MBL fold metallo-hydrolase n=1 Tax=Bradyrhizobium japonicum TaxID=375 RepID=UPI002646359E
MSYHGERILLDLGKPLDAEEADARMLPPTPGLQDETDSRLRAIVISHGHVDHWGLAPLAHTSIPLAMGAATRRILHAAAPFVPNPFTPVDTIDLADRKQITIGPFLITPYLVDHSAFDAYALLVEAGGRRLFYSGDIRAHGRKGSLFERLLRDPPKRVDAMLMEGSSLGRLDEHGDFPTEEAIEDLLVDRFKPEGFVAIMASAQNIDRVVSVYRACKRTGRTLLLDLYAMEILRATNNPNLPAPGWPNLAVYVPEYQRRQIAKSQRFDLLEPYRAARIYREHIAETGARAVMLFRPAMMRDIDEADLWSNARAIWSQWSGYLEHEAGARLKDDLATRNVELEYIHTSGHASIKDLKRLASALMPRSLVPIHTFQSDRFSELLCSVTRRNDGQWWKV